MELGKAALLPLTVTSAHDSMPLFLEDIRFRLVGDMVLDGDGVFWIDSAGCINCPPCEPGKPCRSLNPPILLEPHETVLAMIGFAPDALGPYVGELTVLSNDHARPEKYVTLSGAGVAAAVPEPSTLGLLVTGLVALGAGIVRRRKRSA